MGFLQFQESYRPLVEKMRALPSTYPPHPDAGPLAEDAARLRADVRATLQSDGPSLPCLAWAVHRAFEIRESSWDAETEKYKAGEYEAFAAALAEVGTSAHYAQLLTLAAHWCNDLADWADSILAGTYDVDYDVDYAPVTDSDAKGE